MIRTDFHYLSLISSSAFLFFLVLFTLHLMHILSLLHSFCTRRHILSIFNIPVPNLREDYYCSMISSIYTRPCSYEVHSVQFLSNCQLQVSDLLENMHLHVVVFSELNVTNKVIVSVLRQYQNIRL